VIYLNPTTSTSANVTGTAALAGTVNANFAPGAYTGNKTYDILHSAGLNGTTFNGLVTTGVFPFEASLSYTSTDVLLSLSAALGAGASLNRNQQNVADALNGFANGGGTLPAGFGNLFKLDRANLGNALTALDGENATGAERSAFGLMTQFLQLMLYPYVDGRGAGAGGGPLGFAPDQPASLPPELARAYAGVLEAPPGRTFDQRWSAWGTAFGGTNRANGDAVVGSTTLTASSYGVAAGIDWRASPDTVLGFALAGGGTGWGLTQGLGTGRSDALMAGLYGATHVGPAYVAGSFGYANHWFTTNRTGFAADQLTASFNGQSVGARLEGGWRIPVTNGRAVVGITPYAAAQAQWFRTPAYSETDLTAGGFGLTYDAMTAHDTRGELGARFDALTAFAGMPLILRGRVAWAHDWVSNPALSGVFQALPGATLTMEGAPIADNSALTSASAELRLSPSWSLGAKLDGEFASGARTYTGTGLLRYSW
jgi:outer membrane autotransporter protein